MADRPLNILSLCSGGGGLDLGVELAIPTARAVCYVEREAFAIEVLASAMEAGCLAPAPVWTDLRTFDGRPWRGVVDCLTAGYPCQPFSFAGQRRGAADPRHLWPDIARIIGECEPAIVFLENVGGHVSLGLPEVVSDLRRLGYRVPRPCLLTASSVGATHRRERVFILAVADGAGGRLRELRESSRRDGLAERGGAAVADGDSRRCEGHAQRDGESCGCGVRTPCGDNAGRCGAAVGDAERFGSWCGEPRIEGCARIGRGGPSDAGDGLAHAERAGLEGRERQELAGTRERGPDADAAGSGGDVADSELMRGDIAQAGRRHRARGLAAASGPAHHPSLFPPGPGDADSWRRVLSEYPDLAPALEPGVCRVADGDAPRLDRLRLLGNGVVPIQAAHAFRTLLGRV